AEHLGQRVGAPVSPDDDDSHGTDRSGRVSASNVGWKRAPWRPFLPGVGRRSASDVDVLIAGGAHADQVNGNADAVLQQLHVASGGTREVVRLGGGGQVGAPSGKLLVDGLRLVQDRLAVRPV